ncbi:MAG TPA: response regulator transcription factor [Elusimicrobiales bacterium]|nr:response regulator transcription factor [Elusimicrobiales bacterium]
MLNNVILIVDDDRKIRELLKGYFVKENFTVLTAMDGREALATIKKDKPDIVLLDLMLPVMDGFEVLKQARKEGCEVPVIMITARDEESDKLVGLEIGADDYIAKPFSPKEVVARAKAVLRRAKAGPVAGTEFSVGDIKVDMEKHAVTKNGKSVELTPIEFKILELFCQAPGRVLSRLQIIERVQGYDFDGYQRTVDVHIRNIRKKIEDDQKNPKLLLTVFGFGYKFADPEEDRQ